MGCCESTRYDELLDRVRQLEYDTNTNKLDNDTNRLYCDGLARQIGIEPLSSRVKKIAELDLNNPEDQEKFAEYWRQDRQARQHGVSSG